MAAILRTMFPFSLLVVPMRFEQTHNQSGKIKAVGNMH